MKTNPYSSVLAIPFKCIFLLAFMGIAAIGGLQAQGLYKLSSSKENVVQVSGKSNVHDWTMIAQNPTCEASFGAFSSEGIPKSIGALNFSVNAKNLKSESQSMNNRTYKTIKADAYPKITFKLIDATITPLQKNKFLIRSSGTLTIAGVSKVISMQVNAEVKADNSVTCTGQEKVLLTDYSIQPPSFMLGAMKVGNELMISFTLNLKK